MPTRLGIIGLSAKPSSWATIGHISPLKSNLADKYVLTAVCGSSKDNSQATAKAFGLDESKAYEDAKQLAADNEVDMVTVSVKVPKHKELTIPVIEAGRDVFVEWPLGNGLEEAEELARFAKSKNVRTMVGLQARHAGSIVKAKELIATGTLGKILSTSIHGHDSLLHTLPESNAYIADAENGANLLTISAGHTLDALCHLLGEFEWLNAATSINFPTATLTHQDGSSSTIPRSSPDYLSVQGRLSSGAMASATLYTTLPETPGSLVWVIVGEKGSLKFEGQNCMPQMFPPTLYRSQSSGAGADAEVKWVEVETEPPMAFGGVGEEYIVFAAGEGEGEPRNVVGFEEAVTRHRMLAAIERSAESGKREVY